MKNNWNKFTSKLISTKFQKTYINISNGYIYIKLNLRKIILNYRY